MSPSRQVVFRCVASLSCERDASCSPLLVCVLLSATHVKWCLSSQTLVHNSTYAPQISLGIVVLGHDDLRGLSPDKHSLQVRDTVILHLVGTANHSKRP